MEESGIGGGEVEASVFNHRGADYPGTFVVEYPSLLAGARVESVQVRIAAAEVHSAVCHQRRGLDTDLIMDLRIVSRSETPFLFSGGCIDGIEIRVPAPDVDNAIHHCWRGVHYISGLKSPFLCSRSGI